MKLLTPYLALLLAVAVPAAGLAQPRIIGNLSDGALLGQITNTAQLQTDFTGRRPLLAQASDKLGLTPSDFAEVANDVAEGRARYVEIPRHLDGMAGQHGGHVFAVRDIVIPSNVYGWEVDLERPADTVRVFMPNRCGNISYLIAHKRHIVAAAPYHASAPAAAPVASAPSPAASYVPVAAPTPQALEITPAAAPVLATPAPAPAVHHFPVLPLLALGIIGLTLGHGVPTITLPHHHCGCPHRP